MNPSISRRKLLRGLGAGAVILSPFVRHRLVDAAPSGNLLVILTPNGFVRSEFGAVGTGTNYTFKSSLAPLTPFKKDVTVIRGLSNRSASNATTHEDVIKFLTCVHGNGDKTRAFGPSLDQVLGRHLNTKPINLGVPPDISARAGQWEAISWAAAGAPAPIELDPKKAFSDMFGAIAPPSPDKAAALQAERERHKSVLDFVREDIRLFKGRLRSVDRNNLDLYLESIRDVEKRLEDPGQIADGGGALACDRDAAQQAAARGQRTSDGRATLASVGTSMMDLLSMGLACGVRRIGTLVWQRASGGVNPLGGIGHHDVSHGKDSRAVWARIDTWYAERFAHLLGNLEKLGILDDTIVVWGSEIAESHCQLNCAFVVAGGRNLGMKLGQSIVYPFHGKDPDFGGDALRTARDPRNKGTADLWVSCQKAMGLDDDHFGDKAYSGGGLQELFSG